MTNQQKAPIEKAILDLATLLVGLSFVNADTDVESAEACLNAIDATMQAHNICADLLVSMAEAAAELGDSGLDKYDRAALRCADTLSDALNEAKEWAEDHENEPEPAGSGVPDDAELRSTYRALGYQGI